MVSLKARLFKKRKLLRREFDKGKISVSEYRKRRKDLTQQLERENAKSTIRFAERGADIPDEDVISAAKTLSPQLEEEIKEKEFKTRQSQQQVIKKRKIDSDGNIINIVETKPKFSQAPPKINIQQPQAIIRDKKTGQIVSADTKTLIREQTGLRVALPVATIFIPQDEPIRFKTPPISKEEKQRQIDSITTLTEKYLLQRVERREAFIKSREKTLKQFNLSEEDDPEFFYKTVATLPLSLITQKGRDELQSSTIRFARAGARVPFEIPTGLFIAAEGIKSEFAVRFAGEEYSPFKISKEYESSFSKERTRVKKEVPTAIIESLDPRTAEGLINLGLTFLAIKSTRNLLINKGKGEVGVDIKEPDIFKTRKVKGVFTEDIAEIDFLKKQFKSNVLEDINAFDKLIKPVKDIVKADIGEIQGLKNQFKSNFLGDVEIIRRVGKNKIIKPIQESITADIAEIDFLKKQFKSNVAADIKPIQNLIRPTTDEIVFLSKQFVENVGNDIKPIIQESKILKNQFKTEILRDIGITKEFTNQIGGRIKQEIALDKIEINQLKNQFKSNVAADIEGAIRPLSNLIEPTVQEIKILKNIFTENVRADIKPIQEKISLTKQFFKKLPKETELYLFGGERPIDFVLLEDTGNPQRTLFGGSAKKIIPEETIIEPQLIKETQLTLFEEVPRLLDFERGIFITEKRPFTLEDFVIPEFKPMSPGEQTPLIPEVKKIDMGFRRIKIPKKTKTITQPFESIPNTDTTITLTLDRTKLPQRNILTEQTITQQNNIINIPQPQQSKFLFPITFFNKNINERRNLNNELNIFNTQDLNLNQQNKLLFNRDSIINNRRDNLFEVDNIIKPRQQPTFDISGAQRQTPKTQIKLLTQQVPKFDFDFDNIKRPSLEESQEFKINKIYGFDLPEFKLKESKKQRKLSKSQQSQAFQPSFTAQIFNIKEKDFDTQRLFTGFEVRPLI